MSYCANCDADTDHFTSRCPHDKIERIISECQSCKAKDKIIASLKLQIEPAVKFDKTGYQREYMRRYRAKHHPTQ